MGPFIFIYFHVQTRHMLKKQIIIMLILGYTHLVFKHHTYHIKLCGYVSINVLAFGTERGACFNGLLAEYKENHKNAKYFLGTLTQMQEIQAKLAVCTKNLHFFGGISLARCFLVSFEYL